MKLSLRIEDGPFAGRSLDLQSGVLTIGRDAACGLRFETMTEISRRHATLTREAASFVLADAGSTNGTLLNGRAVDAAAVRDGDLIQLGPRGPRLRVAIRPDAPPATEVAQATAMPTARVPALVERVLYDPMRDKGRRYNPASLVLIFGMLGLGAFFGLFVALLSFFELGFGARNGNLTSPARPSTLAPRWRSGNSP